MRGASWWQTRGALRRRVRGLCAAPRRSGGARGERQRGKAPFWVPSSHPADVETLSLRGAGLAGLRAVASALAEEAEAGDMFSLYGRVGSGKTEFARAFIRQFTHMPHLVVASPTFTLDITYEHAGHTIHHMDLYRMTTPDELSVLRLDRALKDICLVEWPTRMKAHLPPVSLDVYIDDSDARPKSEVRTIQLRPRTVGAASGSGGNKWNAMLAALRARPPPELAPFVVADEAAK